MMCANRKPGYLMGCFFGVGEVLECRKTSHPPPEELVFFFTNPACLMSVVKTVVPFMSCGGAAFVYTRQDASVST